MNDFGNDYIELDIKEEIKVEQDDLPEEDPLQGLGENYGLVTTCNATKLSCYETPVCKIEKVEAGEGTELRFTEAKEEIDDSYGCIKEVNYDTGQETYLDESQGHQTSYVVENSHVRKKYGKPFYFPSNRPVVHDKGKPYKCVTCGKHFPTCSDLDRHGKMHGKKTHTCETCGQSFIFSKTLQQHNLFHHQTNREIYIQPDEPNSVEKTYDCTVCMKKFHSLLLFNKHSSGHIEAKPYKCDTCQACFNLKKNLMSHKLIHVKEAHKCITCGKHFPTCSDLDRHGKTHGKKTHTCETCGQSFIFSKTLQRHNSIHQTNRKIYVIKPDEPKSVEKTYDCTVCMKKFRSLVLFNKHSSGHFGAKPYKCDVCEACFNLEKNLMSHKLIHVKEAPQMCDVCGRLFSIPHYFYRHACKGQK